MGHGFKHGASGAPLNFKVVGGTTEPTNPKENMIWVNTDQKITGWNFSATDPFNFKIASNAGDVVGTAGGITFTKKNDGKSIFAFVRNETFTIPLLVSDSQDAAVLVRSDGEEHEAFSFTYKDKIWYNTYPGLGMDLWDTATPKIANTTDIEAIKKYLVDMLEKAEGVVWFQTGATSSVEFNALKENGIQVYPLSAKQYISGAWVTKTPKSYQDGTWGEWIYILFDKMEGINNLSGWAEYKSDYATNITVNSSGNLQIGMSSHSYNAIVNKTAIDTTPYSVMTFTVVSKNISDNLYIGLSAKTSGMGMGTGHFVVRSTNPTAGTHTIDISALSGVHYFAVSLHAKVSNAVVLSSIKFS